MTRNSDQPRLARGFLAVWLSGMLLLLCGVGSRAVAASGGRVASRPNFLIVLCDDLGYGDLRCYGNSKIVSPHVDRFAREGVKLTSCYAAAANCSPARAGLLTGRTPYRMGIYNWIPELSPMHLKQREITIATILQRSGYATAHIGKWHLNGSLSFTNQPQPSDHGFDYWFSTQNVALPTHHNPDNFVRNGKTVGKLHGYSAELVADESIRWLKEKRDKTKPFFLFVCFHEPHEPIATDHRFTALYPNTGRRSPFDPDVSGLAAHHGNITQMDDGFGRIMKAIDRLELRKNTFVLFTSDNGPAITHWHPYGSAGPLREKKGHLYDGGIRVPGIIRWPGHTRPGSVSDEPICGVDLLPTLCGITGRPIPADRKIDGADIRPIFHNKPIRRTTPLYWQFDVARSRPKVAMRIGDWMVLADLTGPKIKPFGDIRAGDMKIIKTAELKSFELYNLKKDIGERTDMAQREPKRLAEMSARLRILYHEVRDEGPIWPAWKWPHLAGNRINAFIKSLRKKK